MSDKCVKCGKDIKPIDMSFTLKLINRGAQEYLCSDCICEKFSLTRKDLDEMAERFKKEGCALFT